MTEQTRQTISLKAKERWKNRPIYRSDILGAGYAMKSCVVLNGMVFSWHNQTFIAYEKAHLIYSTFCFASDYCEVEVYDWDKWFKCYRLKLVLKP